MNAIYRLLPLMMFICLCLMLWQYVSGAKDGILDFLAAIRWYLLAAFLLMLVLLRAVWLHAHDRAPDWIYRIIPMDILDRLSNRADIEQAADKLDKEAILIDAEAVKARLQSQVVGQDQVCPASSSLPARPAPAKPGSPKCWRKCWGANCCIST